MPDTAPTPTDTRPPDAWGQPPDLWMEGYRAGEQSKIYSGKTFLIGVFVGIVIGAPAILLAIAWMM